MSSFSQTRYYNRSTLFDFVDAFQNIIEEKVVIFYFKIPNVKLVIPEKYGHSFLFIILEVPNVKRRHCYSLILITMYWLYLFSQTVQPFVVVCDIFEFVLNETTRHGKRHSESHVSILLIISPSYRTRVGNESEYITHNSQKMRM